MGSKGESEVGKFDGYPPLIREIVTFLKTGDAPVTPEESIAIYAFMEAADESKRRGGEEVSLEEVLKKARR